MITFTMKKHVASNTHKKLLSYTLYHWFNTNIVAGQEKYLSIWPLNMYTIKYLNRTE